MALNRLRAVSGGSAEGDPTLSGPDASWRASLGDATRAMLEADRRAFLGHTELRLDVIQRAYGATLVDRDGREILDFDGGGGHALGHAHPRIVAAVVEQLHALAVAPPGFTNPPAIAIAQRLADLAPDGLKRVLLASSDAMAIANAIRLARTATARTKVLAVGETLNRIGPVAAGVEHAP